MWLNEHLCFVKFEAHGLALSHAVSGPRVTHIAERADLLMCESCVYWPVLARHAVGCPRLLHGHVVPYLQIVMDLSMHVARFVLMSLR